MGREYLLQLLMWCVEEEMEGTTAELDSSVSRAQGQSYHQCGGGSVRAQSELRQAETGVQARVRMRRADALAAQSCRARTLAVVAGSDHGGGSDQKAQGNGDGSGWDSVMVCATPAVVGTTMVEAGRLKLRWEAECEVAKWTASLLGLNRLVCGSRRVSNPNFCYF